MATPVLPYPDMDFTPLDILTAAEMDQMVANDQYLRDFCAGLADGTNLSDGVIQARKLDWGGMEGAGVLRLGNKKIMWGLLTVNSVASSSDKTATVTFPEAFASAPTVVATVASWISSPTIFINSANTTSASIGVKHIQGTTLNVAVRWIAIG